MTKTIKLAEYGVESSKVTMRISDRGGGDVLCHPCRESVCGVLGIPSQSHASDTPHSRAPAPSEPPPNHRPRPEYPNGQSGAAIAISARAHCCTGVHGTPTRHPTGPAPTAVLHGRRNCPRCPFAPYLPYVAKRVLCMVAHACVGGDDTRDGYGLVWGMMGDDRVPMRTFFRRARRRNVELVGQFTSFSTKDPAIHERLGCGWGY